MPFSFRSLTSALALAISCVLFFTKLASVSSYSLSARFESGSAHWWICQVCAGPLWIIRSRTKKLRLVAWKQARWHQRLSCHTITFWCPACLCLSALLSAARYSSAPRSHIARQANSVCYFRGNGRGGLFLLSTTRAVWMPANITKIVRASSSLKTLLQALLFAWEARQKQWRRQGQNETRWVEPEGFVLPTFRPWSCIVVIVNLHYGDDSIAKQMFTKGD